MWVFNQHQYFHLLVGACQCAVLFAPFTTSHRPPRGFPSCWRNGKVICWSLSAFFCQWCWHGMQQRPSWGHLDGDSINRHSVHVNFHTWRSFLSFFLSRSVSVSGLIFRGFICKHGIKKCEVNMALLFNLIDRSPAQRINGNKCSGAFSQCVFLFPSWKTDIFQALFNTMYCMGKPFPPNSWRSDRDYLLFKQIAGPVWPRLLRPLNIAPLQIFKSPRHWSSSEK